MAEQERPNRRRRRAGRFRPASLRLPLLWLLVLGSVLALGSQQVWALVPLGALATLLAALSFEGLRSVPRPAWLLVGLIAYTLFQLAPLPAGVVERLSPAAAELWRATTTVLKEPAAATMSLSVDPQATALEALKWWIYLAALLGAVSLRRSRGPLPLANLVFVSAALVALLTLLHGALDLHRVYGLYQPSFTTERWQRGPLLNSNNLAAYLNLGLGVTAGLLGSGRVGLPRWVLALGALIMATAVLLSGSRAGLAVMGLLVLGFCIGLVALSGLGGRVRRISLGVLAMSLLATVAALALAGDRLLADWLGQDISRKIAAWRWTLDLIRAYPWVGVGRGAYETAFPMYRGSLGYDWTSVFAYPENVALQWIAEWGLLIGGVGLLGSGWLLAVTLRQARRARLKLGLALGCGALLLQNAADLSSEVAGVMVALVVALAALGGTAEPEVSPVGQSARSVAAAYTRGGRRFGHALLMGLIGLALVGLGLARGRDPAREERATLARDYHALDARSPSALTRFRAELRQAIMRHPGDPYLPLLGGLLARRAGDQNALAWLGHALELGPTTGTVHLALADALHGREAESQAILHLRLASQYDATLRNAVVLRAARWARDIAELERAFPEGAIGSDQLTLACPKLVGERMVECWRRVTERVPAALPREELAESLAAAVRRHEAPCTAAPEGCRAEVERLARELTKKTHGSWRAHAALAEITVDPLVRRQTMRELLERCPGGIDGEACLRRAMSAAKADGDTGALQAVIERFLAVGCAGDAECAAAHDVAATQYAEMNAWALGLKHRQQAARAWPNATRFLAVADAALHAKSLPTAELALQRAEGFNALTDPERAELARLRELLRQTAQEARD